MAAKPQLSPKTEDVPKFPEEAQRQHAPPEAPIVSKQRPVSTGDVARDAPQPGRVLAHRHGMENSMFGHGKFHC